MNKNLKHMYVSAPVVFTIDQSDKLEELRLDDPDEYLATKTKWEQAVRTKREEEFEQARKADEAEAKQATQATQDTQLKELIGADIDVATFTQNLPPAWVADFRGGKITAEKLLGLAGGLMNTKALNPLKGYEGVDLGRFAKGGGNTNASQTSLDEIAY